MADQKAKKAAYSILKQSKLTKVTLDDLIRISGKLGFEILDYSRIPQNAFSDKIIQELGLASFATNGKSFVYKNNDIKLIFLCETMSEPEKLYALAHELGHVCCGHLKNGVCCNEADIGEEQEANEFAHFLLRPGCWGKAMLTLHKHIIISIILATIILCGIVSIPIIQHIRRSQSFYGEYYVTENGEKYHLVDCPIIKDKSNIHRLTIEEHKSDKYKPCHICLPGSND